MTQHDMPLCGMFSRGDEAYAQESGARNPSNQMALAPVHQRLRSVITGETLPHNIN